MINTTAASSSYPNQARVSSNGKSKKGNSAAGGGQSDYINWVYINGLGERCTENVTD